MKAGVILHFIYFIIMLVCLSTIVEGLMENAEAAGKEEILRTATNRTAVKAKELNGGTGWLNTDRPIYIKDLKGKIVLLDFWTYCCINCIHIIPDLKKLEAKYPNELVVIGVHSAKFPNEKDSDNIRQAIVRYGIEHPVVNDSEFIIWRSYGVKMWPTLVLINAEGYISGSVSGEGHYELLDKVIGALIAEAAAKGKLDRTPLELVLEKNSMPDTPLSFPAKLAVSPEKLFISDSNHNRIVITDLDGNVKGIIGSGDSGAVDGSFEEASFNKPQGISLDERYLYIADTGNHLIRRADLETRVVKTIAGTGQQAIGIDASTGEALKTPLSSPWDLINISDKLYIAMAGNNQIWVMDLKDNRVWVHAGSGREAIIDGPIKKGALAQPSGITTDGEKLFIADSEASSIRSVDLDENGHISTIVGVDLFEFGDRDGKRREVRLQHPLGILFHEGKLYVADTYNHKIKIVDPRERTSETFLGDGKSGNTDGRSPRFYEPSGLAISGNKLYIADTNNNAIRVADLSTKQVKTLTLKGLGSSFEGAAGLGFPSETIVLPGRKVLSGHTGNLVVSIKFPPSHGFTEGVPLEYEIETCAGHGLEFAELDRKKSISDPKLPLRIPFRTSNAVGNCSIKLNLNFNYCEKEAGLCSVKYLTMQVPVQITKSSESQQMIFVEYKVSPIGAS